MLTYGAEPDGWYVYDGTDRVSGPHATKRQARDWAIERTGEAPGKAVSVTSARHAEPPDVTSPGLVRFSAAVVEEVDRSRAEDLLRAPVRRIEPVIKSGRVDDILGRLKLAEQAGQNRRGALRAIDERIAALEG